MATWEFFGLASLKDGLRVVSDPPAGPLMEELEKEIVRDNTEKILAGEDKDGGQLPKVTYRPKGEPLKWTKRQQQALAARNGFSGPYAAGADANLTSSEYRRLAGPSTAPRGKDSRVITHLETQHGRDPSDDHGWFAEGVWFDIVSRKGYAFLKDLIVRFPIDGLRPVGQARCVSATVRFCRDLTTRLFGG
jgi:hypothetical protein